MHPNNGHIENQYHKPGLFEDIVERLQDMGVDMNDVTRSDIAGVDEFHVRGAAVSKELAEKLDMRGARILDVGCGIGGPCRMLADSYDCDVTGIDISKEFVRTAKKISALVKLDRRTEFVHGDVNDLPFEENTFDVVWTQHVQMNVPDKQKFYSEIERVLTPDGSFLYYDIFKRGSEDVTYPMPWADNHQISFLSPPNQMDNIMTAMGFNQSWSADQTDAGITFFENLVARITEFGLPKLGLNVVMGASTKIKILNLLNGLKEEKIMLQSGIYKR